MIGLSRVRATACAALLACVGSSAMAAPLASNDTALMDYGATGAALEMITATEGSSCAGSGAAAGAMAFTHDGKLLTCPSGSWVVAQADQADMRNPGYTKLPSGLIIQFGRFGGAENTGYSTARQSVSFRIPFPNSCLAWSAAHTVMNLSNLSASYSGSYDCDKYGIEFTNTVPGRSWIAIGY